MIIKIELISGDVLIVDDTNSVMNPIHKDYIEINGRSRKKDTLKKVTVLSPAGREVIYTNGEGNEE